VPRPPARGTGGRAPPPPPPGLGIDVLSRADRSEMARWLAKLEPSGVPLEAVLAGLGPEDLRGIQTLVIAFPVWHRGERPRLEGDVGRLARLVPRVVCVLAEPGAGEAGPEAEALRTAGADVRRWGPADDLAEAMSGREVRA
jgi:hypothetical protein